MKQSHGQKIDWEMRMEKQQSPNWDKYKDISYFVLEGFPFNEGFPQGGPFGNADKVYEIILRNGNKVDAQVDYSTQYKAEGLTWKCLEGVFKYVDRHIVVAWREK